MAYLQHAVKRYLAHDALHKRRLSLSVLAYKSHLLPTLYGKVYTREHFVYSITLSYFVAYHGIIAAAQTWRELQAQGRVVHLVNLYRLYLLQLPYLLLHLNSLRCLIAETLDERLGIGNLLLLVLIGAQLLLTALTAQHYILVVLHLIVNHLAAAYLQRAVGDVVYKRTVVTHQHHSLSTLRKELLQPLY